MLIKKLLILFDNLKSKCGTQLFFYYNMRIILLGVIFILTVSDFANIHFNQIEGKLPKSYPNKRLTSEAANISQKLHPQTQNKEDVGNGQIEKKTNLAKLNQTKPDKVLSILLVERIYQNTNSFANIQLLVHEFALTSQVEYYFRNAETLHRMKKNHPSCKCFAFIFQKHEHVIDYIITFGGDGAITHAMKDFKYRIPPVITFRGGTLGWTCRFSQTKIAEVAKKIAAYHGGQIKFPFETSSEMRMMVTKRSKVDFKTSRACLNEVFIQRKEYTGRMRLSIFINNKFLTRTTVVGLLIATPTGSTFHSFFSGGPAIQNGVEAIMITPIIPNSLAFRPLLLPATSVIKIKFHKSQRSPAVIAYDAKFVEDFDFGTEIIIKRAKHNAVFYEPKQEEKQMPTWLEKLKLYIGWNSVPKPVKVYPKPKAGKKKQAPVQEV